MSLYYSTWMLLPAMAGIVLKSVTVSAQCLCGICLSANFKLVQYFWNGWSYALQICKWVKYGRVHPGVKNFPWKGHDLDHVTLLKILNPFNISGMDEARLFKFRKWINYGKSHPRGKNFYPKGAGSGSRDHFWDKAMLRMLCKFHKCIDYGECHTRG